MRKYGRETRWCVTEKGDWESYILEDKLKIYILIDKKKHKKYAVVVDKDDEYTMWNELDEWYEEATQLLNNLDVPEHIFEPFTSSEWKEVKDKARYVF
jgi:hypothetical protein